MVRRAQNKGIVDDDEINADIADTVLRYAGEHYLSLKEKLRLKAYIYAAIRGLDVLQELLDDSSITEIMVNGTDDIFV